jgi:hypothetical protein
MKQGELYVFLISKYPVKVYFNAKVMMYEFVLVTKQTIYVYLSWQRILMIQDAESFGFVENVTDTMKFMKFFLFSFIIHVLLLSGLETSTSYLIFSLVFRKSKCFKLKYHSWFA